MMVGIDFDGTITRYPEALKKIANDIMRDGLNVVVILTAAAGELLMCDRPVEVRRRVNRLGWQDGVHYCEIHCCEGHEKGKYCKENNIDLMIDDSREYLDRVKRESPSTICLLIL